MLITGILTCTTAYAIFFPQAALTSMFGASLSDASSSNGALAEIIVRSWGTLVTIVGGTLIYGAFTPKYRPFILVTAGIGKLVFVALLLLLGRQYLPTIATPIAVDSIAVILFAICLPNARREAAAA